MYHGTHGAFEPSKVLTACPGGLGSGAMYHVRTERRRYYTKSNPEDRVRMC